MILVKFLVNKFKQAIRWIEIKTFIYTSYILTINSFVLIIILVPSYDFIVAHFLPFVGFELIIILFVKARELLLCSLRCCFFCHYLMMYTLKDSSWTLLLLLDLLLLTLSDPSISRAIYCDRVPFLWIRIIWWGTG